MKAAVVERYGPPDAIQIKDVPRPTVGDQDILVKVHAVSVTAADSRVRGARFPPGFGLFARLAFGLTKPRVKILGNTFSGVVAEVGPAVTAFQVGDEVCGMTGGKMGTYAEYLVVNSPQSIVKKPATVSHEDAAGMLFGGTTALFFVRDKLDVKEGETVVVNGASGAVGTNAVQLANHFGAAVTGVTSGANAELVERLGAVAVIDYTRQDLTNSGQKFDAVVDTVGNISTGAAKSLLTANGRAGLVAAGLGDMITARGPIKTGSATEKAEDIAFLLSLVEQGKLTVVIDSTYDLADIAKAHQRVDSGRKVGNIVVTIDESQL